MHNPSDVGAPRSSSSIVDGGSEQRSSEPLSAEAVIDEQGTDVLQARMHSIGMMEDCSDEMTVMFGHQNVARRLTQVTGRSATEDEVLHFGRPHIRVRRPLELAEARNVAGADGKQAHQRP